MKFDHPSLFTHRSRAAVFLAGALLLTCGAVNRAHADEAQELHARAQQLMEKAHALKAEGAMEKSQQLANEANNLKEKAIRLAKGSAERGNPRSGLDKERAVKIDQLRAKLQDLLAAGRKDDAARVKQEIAELSRMPGRGPTADERAELGKQIEKMKAEVRELAKLGRRDEAERLEEKVRALISKLNGAEPKPQPDKARLQRPEPPRDRPGQPEGPGDIERRWQHVKIAIENLHAAGWHEPAERLAQDAEKLQRQLRERRDSDPRRPEGDAVAALRKQVEELGRALRELNQRVDKMSR